MPRHRDRVYRYTDALCSSQLHSYLLGSAPARRDRSNLAHATNCSGGSPLAEIQATSRGLGASRIGERPGVAIFGSPSSRLVCCYVLHTFQPLQPWSPRLGTIVPSLPMEAVPPARERVAAPCSVRRIVLAYTLLTELHQLSIARLPSPLERAGTM